MPPTQAILYWWYLSDCGSVCEDTVESLDYGSHTKLIYGITGGGKRSGRRVQWTNEALSGCLPACACP